MNADNLPKNLPQEETHTLTAKVAGVEVGANYYGRPSILLHFEGDVGSVRFPVKYPEQISAFLDMVFYARQHNLNVTLRYSTPDLCLLEMGFEFDQ